MNQDFYHIPYNLDLVDYAREQRQTESLAEKRMWYDILKEKKLENYKFTRQKPLLNYIADFYCSELGLVIEVDGDDHENNKEYDQKRTQDLEKYGLKVMRFHNLVAMEAVPQVEKEILEFIEKRKEGLNPPALCATPLDRGASGAESQHSAIILGCTHYSYLKKPLQKLFPETPIIDPSEEAAEKIFGYIARHPTIAHIMSQGQGIKFL